MPKIHECLQYSDQYDELRLGIPTASKFDAIITPGGKPTKTETWQKYAHHLIAERLLGCPVLTYSSPYMDTALNMESDAVEFYESMQEVKTKSVGFITNDEGTVGCSPDRLIGEHGLLEIKCPQPQTQVEYLLTGAVESRYKPQLQGQLYVTERAWVDICAYHPQLPPVIIRCERDEEYIACLDALLNDFLGYVVQVMKKIKITMKGNDNEQKEIRF